ncbi:hypothetical protein D3C80_553720 [compost metagenome]
MALLLSFSICVISVSAQVIWLRGDRSAAVTTIWTDISGNQHDATAAKDENPSKTGILNYNPVMVFDGVNDQMKIPYSFEGLSGLTVITVFQSPDTTERNVWSTENALSRKVLLTTRHITGPDSAIDFYGQNEKIPVINTITQNWIGTSVLSTNASLILGNTGKASGNRLFKGGIAEYIVFDKVLEPMVKLQFETYLAIKYGIPLKSNYISSDELVLWSAKDNQQFSNRITGIGRDDVYSLYQKQAKSSYDGINLLTISVNNLAKSNDSNTAKIDDKNFLLWGDNNKPLAIKQGSEQNAAVSFLQRQWLMKVNGHSASKLPTELQVKISKFPADSLGYWLVIDRSGKGDFSEDKLEYIFPDSISADSVAHFANIKWDTDQSGSDVFGFAQSKPLFAMITSQVQPTCSASNGGSVVLKVIGGRGPYQYELRNSSQNSFHKGEGAENITINGLSAGDYTFKLKDSKNDVVERTFSLNLPDELIVNLGEDQDLKLSPNKEIILDATAHINNSSAVTYKWTSSHGFSSDAGKIKVSQSGIYTVTVTNSLGCSFSDEIIVSGSVARKFDVFPAPVAVGDNYNVSVSLNEPEAVILKICDLNGSILKEIKSSDKSEYHFMNSLQVPGMYIVILQTSKGIETKKFMVH